MNLLQYLFQKQNTDSILTDMKTISFDEGLMSIKNKINENYNYHLASLAHRYKILPPPSYSEVHANPIILCIGNHSSGKSSFINNLLNQNIQESSTAPMDDGFTIFTFGKPCNSQNFVEQSGEGLVLNQRLPFRKNILFFYFNVIKIN